MAGKAEMDTFS